MNDMFELKRQLKAAEGNFAEAEKSFAEGDFSRASQFYNHAATNYRKASAVASEDKKDEYLTLSVKCEKKAHETNVNSKIDHNRTEDQKREERKPQRNTPPVKSPEERFGGKRADKGHGGANVSDVRSVVDENARFKPEKASGVTFDDVAGLQDVKDIVRYDVIEPLNNPEFAKIYNIEPGAKVLLYGPPGTGKTFIAKAIAGEVDAAFYSILCSDLISKYVGESGRILQELFNEALKNERAVIFFDEFDAVASKRSDASDGADQEIARFVATFLALVDGAKKSETNKMLLLIAATNRPWAVDPAMLRGGRFDKHVYVGLPDKDARRAIVEKTLKDVPKKDDLDIDKIVDMLDGYGGGDITAICKDAISKAYRRGIQIGNVIEPVVYSDFEKAISCVRNVTSKEDIEKFEKYRKSGRID